MQQYRKPAFCYCQWKGSVWGAWCWCWCCWLFPRDPSEPMWNIPGKWTFASLPLETRTESMGSILLFPWRLPGPNRCCIRDIELGCCTMCLKPISDVCCVCDDDRRERAQSESWIWVVSLSQNILLFAPPPVSENEMVFRRGWQTDAPWCDVWLWSRELWKSENCFPPL